MYLLIHTTNANKCNTTEALCCFCPYHDVNSYHYVCLYSILNYKAKINLKCSDITEVQLLQDCKHNTVRQLYPPVGEPLFVLWMLPLCRRYCICMRCANMEERVAKKQSHELWAICVLDVASIKASVKGSFLSRKLQGYNSHVCSLDFFKCISYVVLH